MAFIILVLLMLIVSPSWATTYYVATTGSDSNPGTSGSPYRSIQKCVTVLVAGDICTVADGTYTASDGAVGIGQNSEIVAYIRGTYANGTAVNPITVKSTNPLGAVILIPGASNSVNAGFYLSRNYWIIEGFDITSGGVHTGTSASHHGVYDSYGTGNIIRKNRFRNIARTLCGESLFGNSGVFNDFTNGALIEQNLFYTIGRLRNGESGCSTTIFQHDHGIYVNGTANLTIRRNLIYDVNRGMPINVKAYAGATTGLKIYNNTIAGKSPTGQPNGVIALTNTYGGEIKNNIFFDPPSGYVLWFYSTSFSSGTTFSYNLTNGTDADMINPNYPPGGSGITQSNLTTGTSPGFTSASCTQSDGGCESTDFTLASGSASINAGTNVSLAYNGSAPDIGAYETFLFSVCSVENGDASNLRVSFSNNTNPPLLPTNPTGFTARKAGANDVITARTRVGDNRIDLTLTDAIVAGNAVDVSYSGGNLTDSALIGSTLNQSYVQTLSQQSCTNNVAGAPSFTLTQSVFEFHGLRGTEAAPTMKPDGAASSGAAENVTNMPVMVGGAVRLRISVLCGTADCPPTGFYPRYSRNGGAYTVIPDTFAADNIGFCGTNADPDIPSNGAATTNQLSGGTGFVAGALVRTSNAIPTIDLDHTTNTKTELEYCITFDTDATANDTYDIRIYQQDGTALNTYSNTPRITVVGTAGGSGFTELWDLMMLTMLPMLGRIETNTTKPPSNFMATFPSLDQVVLEGVNCTGLKTSGSGVKRTITCLH